MVEIGDAHSIDFILKLSDFYRFSLERPQKDTLTVQEELKILESYFFLIKARFEDGITLDIAISSEHQKAMIPAFTLQLLTENAVKHNIISVDQPLQITLRSVDNWIVVQNNLQPKNIPERSIGIGLENVNQRYLHLTGQPIKTISDDHQFTVKLPANEHIGY